MYSWRIDTRDIIIRLNAGVYNLPSDSAVGKTYLCKMLGELALRGEPVIGYRYEDECLSGDLVQRIERCHPQILLLDRYNRFAPKYDDLICKIGEKSVVLVDYKDSQIGIGNPCFIQMSPSCIEVGK